MMNLVVPPFPRGLRLTLDGRLLRRIDTIGGRCPERGEREKEQRVELQMVKMAVEFGVEI